MGGWAVIYQQTRQQAVHMQLKLLLHHVECAWEFSALSSLQVANSDLIWINYPYNCEF